jgi:hypothetical protein
MTFLEFFYSSPNKTEGIIDPDGNIKYGEIFSPTQIYFRRMNLEGSLKKSYWDMSIPNFYYLDEKVKDKLKIWAQNMPEFEEEMVHINNIPRCIIKDLT